MSSRVRSTTTRGSAAPANSFGGGSDRSTKPIPTRVRSSLRSTASRTSSNTARDTRVPADMTIPVRRCDAACGAELAFDLSGPIDEASFREIERLFHEHIVVFFRGQNLSNERHIDFSRRFGELEIHIVKKYLLPGHPEILLVSNITNASGEHIGLADAGFTWHSDVSYRKTPSRCSLLYAKEVPYAADDTALGDT